MPNVFAFPALEDAVRADDYDLVVEVLRKMTPEQRRAERKSVGRIVKIRRRPAADRGEGWEWLQNATGRVLLAVAVVCGNAEDAAKLFYGFGIRDVVALATEFRPPTLTQFADELLKESPTNINEVQQLIAAGLIPRPDSDDYISGLVTLFTSRVWRHDMKADIDAVIDEPFKADPGLQGVLLRVLEVDATGKQDLASIEKYAEPERRWSSILFRLVDRGMYSRAQLLDKIVGGLERGANQSISAWFINFHEKLAPSIDELTPHTQRYVAFLSSRTPLIVTFALGVVGELYAARLIPPEQLPVVLRPVASSAVKRQVDITLKLLDRAVKELPAIATAAAATILPALAHESADVQKQVMVRLKLWGMDGATRDALGQYAGGISVLHRDEMQRLAGTQQPSTDLVVPPPPATSKPPAKLVGPLDPSRRIAPIASLDELIERVAYVFENSGDLDELERVLGGLAQVAPLSEEARARFAPVAKRLPRLRTRLAFEVGRVLHFLLNGERLGARPALHTWGTNLAHEHLIHRVDGIMDLAAQGKGLLPLTTPTHLRGFIDPAVLVERVRAHLAANAVTSLQEQASALLRLASEAGSGALEAARELPITELALALRYALGDGVQRPTDSMLFASAERVRGARSGTSRYEWFPRPVEEGANYFRVAFRIVDPSAEPTPDPAMAIERAVAARDRRGWSDRPAVGGREEGFVVYHLMLVPSDLDAFLSDGASEVACNLDWAQTYWHNAAYLRALLDPTVAMSPMATLLLALGLAGKEPGQTAIAVDALVRTHVEGRLDPSLLAAMVRDLLRKDLVANSRYAKSLRAALRIDATISEVIFEVACAALEATPGEPRKDTAAIIDLLLEIAVNNGRKLSAQERGILEQLVVSGKANSLRTTLLKRA